MSRAISLIDIIERYLASDRALLPTFDRAGWRISQEISKPEPDERLVQKWIISDQALTAQVLKTANSAFYQGLTHASTVPKAMTRLGAKEIGNIALMVSQRRNYRSQIPQFQKILQVLWRHAIGCALASQWLARRCGMAHLAHEAFTAGLLHDVGKLLILTVLEAVIRSGKFKLSPDNELIGEVIQNLHPNHGHLLLKQWNLPAMYCDIARSHHQDEFDQTNLLLTTIRLANRTCNRIGIGLEPGPDIVLAATEESKILNLSEILLAELEVRLEDSIAYAR